MASIFVTGSSDGIGQETARQLVRDGHRVVLHARDDARAKDAATAVPEASGVAVGDLSVVAGIRQAAESASALGPYDAVIHNAGVGSAAQRHRTPDGCEAIFAVNVLGPYLVTALMPLPPRLVYLTLPVGAQTQAWLATSDDPDAAVTGRYFKWRRDLRANPAAYDTGLQEALLAACAWLAGTTLPD